MKNKNLILSFKVVILFMVAMVFSLIGENLHTFFGDWYCGGSGELVQTKYTDYLHNENCNYINSRHEATWHWGYRHYLFVVMGFTLFVLQVVNIVKNEKN